MINAKHLGRVALFIVTGFCLLSLGSSAEAKTPAMPSIPGLTFVVSSNFTPFTSTGFNSLPSQIHKTNKPTPTLLEIFVSPTPAILPLEAATPSAQISMVTQEITEGTVTPTPTVLPTITPTPTATTNPVTQTSQTSTPNLSSSGGLNADVLFQMVQDYRAKMGLPAFQTNDQVCSLANSRAPEIGEEIANGHMHSGLKARNLPYWNTENIISMRSESEAFNWWINDYIHKVAIESSNKYSCMACSGDSCAEEFTSLEPK